MPWLIDIDVFQQPKANTNWATLTTASTRIREGHRFNGSNENSELKWDVPLAAGDWTLELMHSVATNNGIAHWYVDDVSIGNVDGYNASGAFNIRSSLTFRAAYARIAEIRVKIETKNASATNFAFPLQWVQLRCTTRHEGGGSRSGRRVTAQWPSNLAPDWVSVDPFMTAVSNTNWDTITLDATVFQNGYKENGGSQNDDIEFDVVLRAGTWAFELFHNKDTDAGIITVNFEGVSQGTIDGYNASRSENIRTSLTGLLVRRSGKHRVQLIVATKNASSSAYEAEIMALRFLRTG